MRFFFEFASCCGLPTQRSPEPAVPAEEEDERSLVSAAVIVSAASSRRSCRKKMRMAAADWRPSLGPILEDCTATPSSERRSPRKTEVPSAGRDAKKRSAGNGTGGGAAKVRYRSYGDGYYGSTTPSMPTMIPSFSLTPFMF